jgi:flagellar basal-body rod modification protein FlgD
VTAPVGSTGNTGATNNTDTTDTSSTGAAGALGENDFLQLLVAQLKYQDPTQPTDPSTFIAQTAQFTQVQDLESLKDTVASLIQTDGMSTATAMLGKTVQFKDSNGISRTGTVTTAAASADGVQLGVGAYQTDLTSVTQVSASASAKGPFTDSTSIAI